VKHNAPNRGREFDRHSGTGRSPVENKKGGAGQANWGALNEQDELTALDDVKAELAESDPSKKDEQKKNKKKKKKGKKGEEEEEKEKKDEIPDEQLKTFDDFLKEHLPRPPNCPCLPPEPLVRVPRRTPSGRPQSSGKTRKKSSSPSRSRKSLRRKKMRRSLASLL